MSSNKTIIPGMEDVYQEQKFSRNNISNKGTCVPESVVVPSQTILNRKPIVGFLYSISKSASGEFWPLRIGSNTIGRSNTSDVCLQEATVSEEHAVVVIRQMKNPEKLIASICDSRSTCGTMINGTSLGFDQVECFNNDIITIGEHYDLLFVLIDSKQIGLNVCRDFLSTKDNILNSQQGSDAYVSPSSSDNKFTRGFDEDNVGDFSGDNEVPENIPTNKPGGTIFM